MSLIKWEPSEGLTSLRRDMDRLLDDFFGNSPFHFERGDGFSPNVEVSDTKESVIVKAQVPGVSQENIQVSVTDDSLTLKGEMKEEETKDEKNIYRREFRYGSFSRTIPLPTAVHSEKAEAKLKDGVLEITIPKSEKAKVKEIPVQV
ncbi:Hsp20/alpha crystallin family protein [Candidatus Entotheonella palauensis]|uniref:Hsp20/alpha crystallin family protein n=1 Tax=Candidatus Entotheonella palauensis TaxID=93172 RepID=UPI000B7C5D19|nr:Hsp20/alpha crystallin family protein [Candidatus Entotheonella palauensis]